jgi:hypothetical protein
MLRRFAHARSHGKAARLMKGRVGYFSVRCFALSSQRMTGRIGFPS